VRALIIEDIGVEVHDDLSFMLNWEGEFETEEAFEQRVGPCAWHPICETRYAGAPRGLTLAFEPRDIVASAGYLAGDYWRDCLATHCPALVIRGSNSRVTTQAALEAMVSRRPNTWLAVLEGGHAVHVDNVNAVAEAVKSFLLQHV
jgi:esterase